MHKIRIERFAATLCILIGFVSSFHCGAFCQAQTDDDVADFVSRLRGAVEDNNRQEVASMLSYPVYIGGNPNDAKSSIGTEKGFLRSYDTVMTERVRRVIREQQWTKSDDEYFLGSGEVWITRRGSSHDFRITAFNWSRCAVAGVAFEDASKISEFVDRLRRAVRAHDRRALAGMVHYPLRVQLGRRRLVLRDKNDFIAHWHSLISRNVEAAILKQKGADVFCNSDGIMIGNGQLWFNIDNRIHTFLITSIQPNEP